MPFERTEKVGEWVLLDSTSMTSATSVRLVEYPEFEWDLPLSLRDYVVAACEFGGPVALVQRGTNLIVIYTSLGAQLSEAHLGEASEKVKFMCWNIRSEQEHLVVLLYDGTVHFINVRGESIATPVKIENPTIVTSTGNGIACVTEASKLVLLECQFTGEYRARTVELPPTAADISCMTAIPESASDSGYVEVLLAPNVDDQKKASTLVRAKFHSSKPTCEDMRIKIDGGTVVRMALSSSKTKLALLNVEGHIYVSSLDLQDLHYVTSTEADVPPAQMAWCGDKCIAYTFLSHQFDEELEYETTLNIFDPNSPDEAETLATKNKTEVLLVPECDGIRLLSPDAHQFLQAVPIYAQRLFLKGSTAPSALLLAAFDDFMLNNAGSVQLIRELTHRNAGSDDLSLHDDEENTGLPGAIDDCVATAGFEFQPEVQKRLLRVANFGKSFCSRYDTVKFVNTTRRLRALNALRNAPVGMCITMTEFATLEGERLAKRLVQQGHYRLAFEICSFLEMNPNLIMIDWAMQKISNSVESDQTVAKAIISKFETCRNISYERVAMAAHARGKDELAILLLGAEPSPKNQVPTLLDIHKEDIALAKAIDSGDTSLVFMVVIRLLSQRGGKAAVDRIVKDTVARDMLLVYCLACESQRYLLDYYRTYDATYKLHLSLLEHIADHDRLKVMIQSAKKWEGWETFHNVKITTMQNAQFAAKADPSSKQLETLFQREQELLEEQGELARECAEPAFLSATVAGTIRLCWAHNKVKHAEKYKKAFQVTDKMYWWAKLKGLVDAKEWDAVDKMGGAGRYAGTVKNSPIGWVPFVSELLRGDAVERAIEYIARVPEISERLELYIECGAWRAAAEDCIKDGNEANFNVLASKARGNAAAVSAIELAQKEMATRKESGMFSKLFK